MEITVKEFGNRIKLLRQKGNLSQEELAVKVSTSQNIISRLEVGDGGSLKVAFDIINFFRTMFNLDNFLSDKFNMDSINLNIGGMRPLDSVAIERLVELQKTVNEELNYSIGLLQGEAVG